MISISFDAVETGYYNPVFRVQYECDFEFKNESTEEQTVLFGFPANRDKAQTFIRLIILPAVMRCKVPCTRIFKQIQS